VDKESNIEAVAKTIRMTANESAAIDRACAVLRMGRASLIKEAAMWEAARLGVRFTLSRIPPLKGPWPYLPSREEPTAVRTSFSCTLTEAEIIARAADHVQASEALFLVGATLAYIGRLQRCFTAMFASDEARKILKDLASIKLPEAYRYGEGEDEPAGGRARRLFGERVRKLRTDAGLSEKALASRVGLTLDALFLIEEGKQDASGDTIRQLAEALRVPLGKLLEG